MSIGKTIKNLVNFDRLSAKITRSQCSLLAHFNEPQPIKVTANFSKNALNGFCIPSRHEDYDLERAVKVLHIAKNRYKL